MTDLWIDVFGWAGVVLYLAAYLLVSTRKLEGDSLAYQWMNIAGGILLVVNSFYYHALPSVGVNLAWIVIALFALGRKVWLNRKAGGP